MSPFSKADLLRTYENHPLREGTLRERVTRQLGPTDGVTELDLAFDEDTEITDQNHIGGAPFVEELAECAGIQSTSRVLDLCSGLGGPARLLAFRHRCEVLGIDLSPIRCGEAQSLTEWVGLSELVNFSCGDVTSIRIPEESFDVVWSQNSLIHVADRSQLFQRWSTVLTPDGRIAIEDCYMKHEERSDAAWRELKQCWLSHIGPLESWTADLAAAGFEIELREDLSGELVAWFSRLLEAADRLAGGPPPETELRGWERARDLGKVGQLGYFRLVGRKRAPQAPSSCRR